jgi:hypothetical protein
MANTYYTELELPGYEEIINQPVGQALQTYAQAGMLMGQRRAMYARRKTRFNRVALQNTYKWMRYGLANIWANDTPATHNWVVQVVELLQQNIADNRAGCFNGTMAKLREMDSDRQWLKVLQRKAGRWANARFRWVQKRATRRWWERKMRGQPVEDRFGCWKYGWIGKD